MQCGFSLILIHICVNISPSETGFVFINCEMDFRFWNFLKHDTDYQYFNSELYQEDFSLIGIDIKFKKLFFETSLLFKKRVSRSKTDNIISYLFQIKPPLTFRISDTFM